MGKKRRPCPRGLYDGCPIPRELCGEDFEATGRWHCMKFLADFEWCVFGSEAEDTSQARANAKQGDQIVSMEDLMQVLEGMEGES